ncbi:hypothetical protein SprV_0401406500 [Sparganum proliferum]
MAEHAAAMRRNDANSQVAAHSTGSDHTFEFDEAEILVRALIDATSLTAVALRRSFNHGQSRQRCADGSVLGEDKTRRPSGRCH